ncbi:MAG: ABC transporter permease subunit, partial [Clostridia bacterium]
YEAAGIDGAGRLRKIWHVTLPGLRPTIIIMLILSIGQAMNAGFEQIFSLRNSVVQNVVDIIDTYVYDITFGASPNYGFSTAVGLFKSVINCALLVMANTCSQGLLGQGLFGERKEEKSHAKPSQRAA